MVKEITQQDVVEFVTKKPSHGYLTLRERLILRFLIFIVDWLGSNVENFYPHILKDILKDFEIDKKDV